MEVPAFIGLREGVELRRDFDGDWRVECEEGVQVSEEELHSVLLAHIENWQRQIDEIHASLAGDQGAGGTFSVNQKDLALDNVNLLKAEISVVKEFLRKLRS